MLVYTILQQYTDICACILTHAVDGDLDILGYCHDSDGQDPRAEDPRATPGHTDQGGWGLM